MSETATRKPTAIIDPTRRRYDAKNAIDGVKIYVVKCIGCAWHSRNPIAYRIFFANPEFVFELGDSIVAFHPGHPQTDWGTWKVLGIVDVIDGKPVSQGEIAFKDKGKNPVLWAITPYVAETETDESESAETDESESETETATA